MTTNLPREVYPNPEAGKSVVIDGRGFTNVVSGAASIPYAYVLNTELTSGIYKIVLFSNSAQTSCGRWAGVVSGANKGIKTFHIDPNGFDRGTVQFGSRGIKANGDWLYQNTSQLQIPNWYSGPVELALELHIGVSGNPTGTLYASVNGNWLPNAVRNIPPSVYFVYEVFDSLNLSILSFQKLSSPTINTGIHYTFLDFPPEEPKVVSRSFASPVSSAPASSAPTSSAPASSNKDDDDDGSDDILKAIGRLSDIIEGDSETAAVIKSRAFAAPAGGTTRTGPFKGIVTFLIKGGKVVAKSQDLIGKGDPYVVITIDGQKKKTTVKKNTATPEWNEKLIFEGVKEDARPVIEIWDHDTITKDDLVGSGVYSVGNLVNYTSDGKGTELAFPLNDTKGKLAANIAFDAVVQ